VLDTLSNNKKEKRKERSEGETVSFLQGDRTHTRVHMPLCVCLFPLFLCLKEASP
jgi:hypothetical protein